MNLLHLLTAAAPLYRGEGINHEGERFDAELRIERLAADHALLLRYRATLDDGSLAHEEATLLGLDADGRPCLWPVMSELPVVLPHRAVAGAPRGDGVTAFVFASGPRDDAQQFREEITIEHHPDASLVYAHAWGMPGEAFAPRSSARLVAAAPAG